MCACSCVCLCEGVCACLVDANYSHRLTVTSITVSHTEQPTKHAHRHTHAHTKCACVCTCKLKHPNSHIYAHPHVNARDTIYHSPHTHTEKNTLSMYILQPPWPSSFFVLFISSLVLSFSLFVLICSAVRYELCIISLWSEKS